MFRQGAEAMRLNQFKYLIALEESGSFSKAAQVLFISQPSLSVAMKELEDELGFEIICRSKKGITLTSQGEQVLKESKIIMDAVKRIQHIDYQENGNLKGKLRVGGVPYFCDVLLVDTLMNLQQQYPELLIQLIEDDTDFVLKAVAKDNLDLGIILVSYLDEADKKNEIGKIKVCYHKLFDDQMVFVAREGHPLSQQKSLTIEKVLEYPFITHRKSANPVTEKLLQGHSNSHKMLHISGFHNLRQYLLRSDAVSVFPSKAINKIFLSANEKLQIITVNDFIWPCQVGWVSKKEIIDLSEEVFVRALKKQCSMLEKRVL